MLFIGMDLEEYNAYRRSKPIDGIEASPTGTRVWSAAEVAIKQDLRVYPEFLSLSTVPDDVKYIFVTGFTEDALKTAESVPSDVNIYIEFSEKDFLGINDDTLKSMAELGYKFAVKNITRQSQSEEKAAKAGVSKNVHLVSGVMITYPGQEVFVGYRAGKDEKYALFDDFGAGGDFIISADACEVRVSSKHKVSKKSSMHRPKAHKESKERKPREKKPKEPKKSAREVRQASLASLF